MFKVLDMAEYNVIDAYDDLASAIRLALFLRRGFVMQSGHVVYCSLTCSPKLDNQRN
jgi:hypothetical protein